MSVATSQNVINVKPYEKVYLHGLPGSSPLLRPNPSQALSYDQKDGKPPLVERIERLRRLHEIQKRMVSEAKPEYYGAQKPPIFVDYMKN